MPDKPKSRFEYQEASLEDVMRFFAKEYEPKYEGEQIIPAEWFVDVARGKVVFKLWVQVEEK